MKLSTQLTASVRMLLAVLFMLCFAQNSLAQCADPSATGDCDGDLVLNGTDLDNDNDGVLDSDEGCLTPIQILDDFQINGSATRAGMAADELQLTQDVGSQSGSAFSNSQINFNLNFTLSYQLYLGTTDNNGADGIGFIFHADPGGSGVTGNSDAGLGVGGIANGVVIEFDTWVGGNNDGFGDSGVQTDPDHTWIWDSDTGDSDPDDGSTPVYSAPTALPSAPGNPALTPFNIHNLEDGDYHEVVITWNATTQTLSYTIQDLNNNNANPPGPITSAPSIVGVDLVNNYFGGNNLVYYGFGAGTGGFSNDQRVRNIRLSCTQDTDGDGTPDYLDTDSDNDGCSDAIESGGIDANGDGELDGTGYNNANGQVTGGTGGYNGVTGDEVVAFGISNTTLTNQSILVGNGVSFTAAPVSATTTTNYTGTAPSTTPDFTSGTDVSAGLSYQWYLGDPNSGGTALNNNALYSGTTTATLSITDVTGLDANEYYVLIDHTANNCDALIDSATLTVTQPDIDGDGVTDLVDLDDDNDGILDTDEDNCLGCSTAQIFQNGSFESNSVTIDPAQGWLQTDEANIPGWETTSPDGLIEIWLSGNNPVGNMPAQEGNTFAELNAAQAGALYQFVCAPEGTVFRWSVWHRGRVGTDVADVKVGASVAGATTQLTMTTDQTAWVNYTGTYTVPAGQSGAYFVFEAVSTSGGNATVGNFIDNAEITILQQGGCDTDGDGIPDRLDYDSDNDGCPDADEAYGASGTDTNNDGTWGGVITDAQVNANGLVIAAGVNGPGNAYTTVPAQTVGGDNTFQSATSATVDFTALVNQSINVDDDTTFTLTSATATSTNTWDTTAPYNPDYTGGTDVSPGLRYQWYLGDPATTGVALTNVAPYSGVTTPILAITDATIGLDGNQYYLEVTHIDNPCISEVGNATLTIIDPCDAVASGNTDTDGDSISDICDLDDDNDGILDTDECVASVFQNGDFSNGANDWVVTGNWAVAFGGARNLGANGIISQTISALDLTSRIIRFDVQARNQNNQENPTNGEISLTLRYGGVEYLTILNNTTNTVAVTPQNGALSSVTDFQVARPSNGFASTATIELTLPLGVSNSGLFEIEFAQETVGADDDFYLDNFFGPTFCDQDGDGISNQLDLDADNDGIYDVDEVGGTDANNDGIADGAVDPVTGIASSAGAGITPIDTGSDGSYDFLNTDSDGDGCTDANEAYSNANADNGDGGEFGAVDGLTNADAEINNNGLIVGVAGIDYTTGTNSGVTDASDTSACVTCAITNIDESNVGTCSDNGTPSNYNDDTFTADITVTFTDAPATGTLDLSGDGTASVAVSALNSATSHTFVGVVLAADGSSVDLTATFSDLTSCSFQNPTTFQALFECSDDGCPDVIAPSNPSAPITPAQVNIGVSNPTDPSQPANLDFVDIFFQPNNYTGIIRPTSTNYQFTNSVAANQFIVDQTVTGSNITDGAATFNPALIEANANSDLRHYLSLDNGITATDYVEFIYNSPITSASNKYVVITERGGNNELTIQALDGSQNLIGSPVNVAVADYLYTPAVADFGQNIFMAIYPLTALSPRGTTIQGIRITQSGATGADGGDGKAFIIYDPLSYTPPPSIEVTSSATQPACPANLGAITVDATDNGGGTIEYSLTSFSGTNDQVWQASNVFNNLPPDSYTPVVRYQATPTCQEVANTPIVLNFADCPSIEAVKVAAITNDVAPVGASLGDTVTYTITVENTGNVTLDNVAVTDTFVDANGNPLTLTTNPTFVSATLGSSEGILQVGETATYTATYVIAQDAVDAGGFSNSVLAEGDSPADTPVNDTSDDGDDSDGNTTDDPTETDIPEDPSIEAVKVAAITNDVAPAGASLGDTVTYTITVENTGNVTLDNVAITDTFVDANGNPLTLATGPIFVSADAGSSEGILQVGETATYTATYVIAQDAVDAGGFSNSVLAEGDSPADTPVNDTSDDGDDSDGNTTDDPTETDIPEDPSIEAVKTVAITNDVVPAGASLGDTVTYTITVENTGNVTLDNVVITDTCVDANGNPLTLTTGPTFTGADLGSVEGVLQVGETATYTATYVISQSTVDAGGFSNSVLAEGDSPADTPVNDTSDDNDDNDGNTTDDPTEIVIIQTPSISLIKTTLPLEDTDGDGIAGSLGDIISYVFTVENTGNVTLTNIEVQDALPGLTLVGGPIATLAPGDVDTTTFTATYVITQADLDAGFVENSATVTGEAPSGDLTDPSDDVTDTSDDPNDTNDTDPNGDGNPDDPTRTIVNSIFDVEVTKVVDAIQQPVVGDLITFTIEVANIGNVTATNVAVSEQIPSGYEFVSVITTAGTYSDVSGEWTVGQLDPDQVEILQITVEVLGFGDYVNTAFVSRADGGTDINENNDEDQASVDPLCLTIYNEFSPDGDGTNETFVIDCIERFPNNTLEIYNRWGNKVYSTKGYLNDWTGTSNGRSVINQSDELPVGTYYYVLDLKNGSEPRVGWLYINRRN